MQPPKRTDTCESVVGKAMASKLASRRPSRAWPTRFPRAPLGRRLVGVPAAGASAGRRGRLGARHAQRRLEARRPRIRRRQTCGSAVKQKEARAGISGGKGRRRRAPVTPTCQCACPGATHAADGSSSATRSAGRAAARRATSGRSPARRGTPAPRRGCSERGSVWQHQHVGGCFSTSAVSASSRRALRRALFRTIASAPAPQGHHPGRSNPS